MQPARNSPHSMTAPGMNERPRAMRASEKRGRPKSGRPTRDATLLDLGLRLPLHEGRVGLLQQLRVDHALRRELLLDAVERVQEVYELAHALGDPIVHLHR